MFGSRTFVTKSWMCKKQTSLSHSSTESEIVSLDAGLRKNGITALDFWDVVMEVLPSSIYKKSSILGAAASCLRNINTKLTGNQNVDQVSDLDHVATNACSSQCDAELYIFGDSEAVIKMIIEGGVQNLQCRAFFWLFDRINLDPKKPQIKCVDTKNQLADSLTNGNFTRDEWNHLIRLCNIMNISVSSCSHFKSIIKSKIMSKRPHEGKPREEDRVVVKSKPIMSSVLKSVNRIPMLDSGVSNSLGNCGLRSQSSDRFGHRNENAFASALPSSPPQVPLPPNLK